MQQIFSIAILLFSIVNVANSQTIISGKVLNHDGKTPIKYAVTKQGIFSPYYEEVMPDTNGKFKIKVKNSGYGTTQIYFKLLKYRLFHDDNSRISMELDQSIIKYPKRFYGHSEDGVNRSFIYDSVKQAATKSISGDYREINIFYNQNERISTMPGGSDNFARPIIAAKSPKDATGVLDSLVQEEIENIDALTSPIYLEKKAPYVINEEVKDILRNEVYAFYANVFINAMFKKRMDQVDKLKEDSTIAFDIYNEEWEQLTRQFLLEMKQVVQPTTISMDYNWFIFQSVYAMEFYQTYQYPQYRPLDGMVESTLIATDSLLLQDTLTVLAYRLRNLDRYLNDPRFYSPVLLDAFFELQRMYPDSKHLEFYMPKIERVKRSVEAGVKDYDKILILKKNYTSFNDFLGQFKGSNLLIDVWATWCHPCISDFKYKENIQQFIDSKDLTVVYVSIDKPPWKDRWQQTLKYNELEGYHIRANNELIEDMWDFLGGYQGAIPRYALISKDGTIFKATASRPRDNGRLVAEIEEMIIASY